MGADQWIAAAALSVTLLGGLASVVYRLGGLAADLREVRRRVERIEDKLDHRRAPR